MKKKIHLTFERGPKPHGWKRDAALTLTARSVKDVKNGHQEALSILSKKRFDSTCYRGFAFLVRPLKYGQKITITLELK